MAKKLFVRFSTSQDQKDIFDFYQQHKHGFVFQRDPEVWKERIAAGAVTIIQGEDGKIVAASISYPITQKDAKGADVHQWTEIGSVRVALDGIGLAKTLISAQILRAYMFEPPGDRFVLEIVVGNSHSKHVFTKMGATLYDMPADLEKKVKATIVPGTTTDPVEWFQMGVETIPELAENLLIALKNPLLQNKKTGEEYELDFSRCVLISTFKAEISDISLQNFGNSQKPDMKHGLNYFKNKFKP